MAKTKKLNANNALTFADRMVDKLWAALKSITDTERVLKNDFVESESWTGATAISWYKSAYANIGNDYYEVQTIASAVNKVLKYVKNNYEKDRDNATDDKAKSLTNQLIRQLKTKIGDVEKVISEADKRFKNVENGSGNV